MRLSGPEFETALQKLEELWNPLYIHEVTDRLIHDASAAAKEHALRAYDALHLASLTAFVGRSLTLACWDHELRSAARERGVDLLPAEALTDGLHSRRWRHLLPLRIVLGLLDQPPPVRRPEHQQDRGEAEHDRPGGHRDLGADRI